MSGYLWDPVFRLVPKNGLESVIVLADSLTDLKGHRRVELKYLPDIDERIDVNRSQRPMRFGFRPEVKINSVIATMDDQSTLAEIASALMDPEYDVYLSLDSRLTERKVTLVEPPNPKPLHGKTFAGAEFDLRVQCVDLIDRIPNMMTDPATFRELVDDGGFENWVTASNSAGWTEYPGTDGTVAQVNAPANVRSGSSAVGLVKVTISDVQVRQAKTGFEPGANYLVSGWVRTETGTASVDVSIYNYQNGTVRYYRPNYGDWGTTYGVGARYLTATTSYQEYTHYFRSDYAVGVTKSGLMTYALSNRTSNSTVYWDDFSITGPILRSGYATW